MKANSSLVAKVAAQYSDALGSPALTEMFKSHKADEALFGYLGSLVNSTLDPEVHFGYIEAATKSNNIAEVELGFGRIVALHERSSTSCQVH